MNMSIGFFGLLTLLFIGLKLTSYITWSWWWILAPIWIGIIWFLLFNIIIFIILIIIDNWIDKYRFRRIK